MLKNQVWAWLCLLCCVSFASAEGLDSRLDVYVVSDDDALQPASEALPGQILEYHLVYNNTTDDRFNGLTINGLIPTNTQYVANTAHSETPHQLLVSFDGGREYQPEPATRTVRDDAGNVIKRELVKPSEYTHLRWVSQSALNASESQTYIYRVLVQ